MTSRALVHYAVDDVESAVHLFLPVAEAAAVTTVLAPTFLDAPGWRAAARLRGALRNRLPRLPPKRCGAAQGTVAAAVACIVTSCEPR